MYFLGKLGKNKLLSFQFTPCFGVTKLPPVLPKQGILEVAVALHLGFIPWERNFAFGDQSR